MDLGVSPISGKRRNLADIPVGIERGLKTLADFLNKYQVGTRNVKTTSGTPAAVVTQPMMSGLGPNYKQEEYDAGLAAQKFRYGAGLPGQQTLVFGVDDSGNVDRSQSDEYKSQMAQYRNLISQKKTQEAEDLGMKIFMDKYGKTPMAQPGGAVGAYNPLLAKMFPDTGGYAGTFEPVEEFQMGDLGTRAQGEGGYTMESLNPMAAQAAQQAATADQADMATTVKLPVRDRVAQLRSQVLGGY